MAATLFVQPLDLVKNRMQLSGELTYQSMYVDLFYLQHTLKYEIQILKFKFYLLKRLGLYLDSLMIGYTFLSMLSILNE